MADATTDEAVEGSHDTREAPSPSAAAAAAAATTTEPTVDSVNRPANGESSDTTTQDLVMNLLRDGLNRSQSNLVWYRIVLPSVVVLVIAMRIAAWKQQHSGESSTVMILAAVLNDWIVWPLYRLVLSVTGITIGVALGLGLAGHVYDQLTRWQELQDEEEKTLQKSSLFLQNHPLRKSPSSAAAAATMLLEDEQTYQALMQTAGYPPVLKDHKILRGQVVRNDTVWLQQPNYGFDGRQPNPQHAVKRMQEFWPTLPAVINEKLGGFMELLLRDYVACWYSSVDAGCAYRDARTVLKEQQQQPEQSQTAPAPNARAMLYSLALHRTSPILDKLYDSMAIVFGNLATRVEHMNVFHVVLLQWTRVLAHSFKVYRTLRKSVVHKRAAHHTSSVTSSSLRGRLGSNHDHEDDVATEHTESVSEIAMTKEFLFAGKLHRAITFGLDVPSLLFADASGRECGTPSSSPLQQQDDNDDDQVLAERLFDTNILQECELDYNRVVAHRMIRALVTRQDYGSPVVAALLTEILAGCVLSPLMSVFCPDYLNSWIITGLSSSNLNSQQEEEGDKEEPDEAENEKKNGHEETTMPMDSLVGDAPVSEALAGEEQILDTRETNQTMEPASSKKDEYQVDTLVPPVTFGDYSEGSGAGVVMPGTKPSLEDNIISLLSLALVDLQKFVDFDDCRSAREQDRELNVNWDDPGCRTAVLRLVLVIELALTHGRCTYKMPHREAEFSEELTLHDNEDDLEELDSERAVEVTLPEYESATLSQILMEMTSDIDAFEERVATENTLAAERNANKYEDMMVQEYKPTATEQSTLRTLTAAWLHTGQIYRMVTVLIQAHATVLAPYYHSSAFLRSRSSANGFVRQLKALAGVDILVDTMTVLDCPRLDETDNEGLRELVRRSTLTSTVRSLPSPDSSAVQEATPTSISAAQLMVSSSTPRYLDFHRNESFASSLRTERERRMLSWQSILKEDHGEGFVPVCRSKGGSQEDIALHQEMHHIARIFYTGTNIIGIRDAARRKNSKEGEGNSHSETSETDDVLLSLLTVETACPRRRIEVPDDDSSFLLRAQPRALNVVGVHRDQRNHDQSFKCFAATYEEPVLKAGRDHYSGGRYVRRCLIRYYPIDRTASVSLQNDARKLDQRKVPSVPETITIDQSARQTPFLSADFLRERHLCQRWVPKGTARSQSILASSVMEPTDFTSAPRTGKAIDFVNKMTFFEKPMIDLGGKRFTVHDSTSLGVHRADASAMELSDASLSAALLTLGTTIDEDQDTNQHRVQMGKDGYPVIWMKFSRKQDDAHVEVKPYRTSFVRAALMVTAARQEAQLQCLVKSVRAGSAKKATKALTDAQLKPTQTLVEYAGNRSREKQSLLLRDLKLGVNHIDREQLRRNGLLSPRYPTELVELSAIVEDTDQTTDASGDFFGISTTVYKIRCVAKVCLVVQEEDLAGGELGYCLEDGRMGRTFREEWVVYRSFKEFQSLHKHLKQQVSANLSSGTASSRLVGAATAAFAGKETQHARQSHRNTLIPSLSQASKAGALGVTKKSISRRKELLNGYIGYILSEGHLLSRSAEVLLFLGAFYPFPPQVRMGKPFTNGTDPLGRSEMLRSVIQERLESQEMKQSDDDDVKLPRPPSARNVREVSTTSNVSDGDNLNEDMLDDGEDRDVRKSKKIEMLPAIRAKIDKVPLPLVRNRLFELLRYQFGFENASFIRNRMLGALKILFSLTSSSEFRRTLYKIHTERISANAIADWIQFGCDLLWPDGVFFTAAPPLTKEELDAQKAQAQQLLHESFPEQLRAILGQELTRDGLDIFHEMLQNRVVVKSMAYMIIDLVWLEVFPEIGDVLQCGAALDFDQ